MRLIDADALYEKTANWEAQALHMVEVTMYDEDKLEEWRKWSAVLTERSAFKHDIADAPTIDAVEVKHGKWEVVDQEEPKRYGCSVCKRLSFYVTNYCSCCGAKMDGERRDPCSSQDS